MTPGRPIGFPTPSTRNASASAGPFACRISLSQFVASVEECDCHPLGTAASSVHLHHSILEAYEDGFVCLWRVKSE